MLNLNDAFSTLPESTKEKLLQFYGSRDAVVKHFEERYGTYAIDVLLASNGKKEYVTGPFDPIVGVNVTTGKVHFNHINEYYNYPWSKSQPRADSHINALCLGEGES